MTLELYHSPYSTCSQKVRLALAEKRLDYVSKELSFHKEEHLSADYLAMNPNGVLPTLVHDGAVFVDSSCIIEYLDEVFPEPPLSPDGPVEKARMRAWLRYMEEVPTVAVRMPSFQNVFLPTLRAVGSKKSFEKSAARRTLRKGFYNRMNSGQGFEQSDIDNSIAQLSQTVRRMNDALEKHPWVLGDQFTLVDIGLAPLVDRIEDLGMDYLWAGHPAVGGWLQRVQSRLSFKTAFCNGSRLSQRPEFKLAIGQSREKIKRKRQPA